MGTTHFDNLSVEGNIAAGGSTTLSGDLTVHNGVYFVVQAHKSSVGNSQSDAEIFEYTMPFAATLAGVQVYCTATNSTASVDVKEAGTTVLDSAVTPTAGNVVAGTVSDADIASGAALTVHATTDGTGDITDLTVALLFKVTVI